MAKPTTDVGGKQPIKGKKKKKKKSGNRLQEQMEFYFSDSNLRRDRFLREKLSQSVPVEVLGEGDEKLKRLGLDLSIFINFNQIKAHTTDVQILKDALGKSSVLSVFQVTAEPSQFLVTRRDWEDLERLSDFLTELDGNNQEFDKRTIYCENLPINASQQWLRQIFSRFGPINLVSVPKFKGNQKIKQFCFIEFADEATMPTVLDYFREFEGVLCYDEAEMDNLQSIQKFHEENKEAMELGPSGTEATPASGSGGENPGKKRRKHKNKNKEGTKEDDEEEEEEVAAYTEDQVEEEKPTFPELNDNMIYDMKIMPKVEWKRLRNKYLNLQREMVRQMKKQGFFRKFKEQQQQKQKPQSQTTSNNKRALESEEATGDGGEGSSEPKANKRRKRGREKIKEALKKSSHIFFET